MALSLDHLLTLPLNTVLAQARCGEVPRARWETYAHVWQTSAPRFEIRACNCLSCVRDFPAPDFKPLPWPIP